MGTYCSVPLSSPPWYASFFLDPGVRWCRMLMGDVKYVHAVPWIALVLLICRSLLESVVAGPLGLYYNVKDRAYSYPPHNPVLTKAYSKCTQPGQDMLQQLSQQVGWSPYKVHKWFVRNRHCGKPSQLNKFKESCWRLLIYTSTSLTGLYFLTKEDFFWDLKKCYYGFPGNTPSERVMGYWAFQLAFYLSLLISHRHDVRRSDYSLMLFHHFLTVLTLSMCYFENGVQIGVLIALTHDIADVPLELAKLFKYIHYEKSAQVTFVVFGVFFFVSRMVVYPFYLLHSVVMQYPVVVSHSPAYWTIVLMLTILQVMHLYWFRLIAKMLWSLLTTREIRDIRSDSEQSPYINEDDCMYWSDTKLTYKHL